MAKLVTVEWIDLEKVKIHNWNMMAVIRNAWERIKQQAKTHSDVQWQQKTKLL
jgi:hypothetical protein